MFSNTDQKVFVGLFFNKTIDFCLHMSNMKFILTTVIESLLLSIVEDMEKSKTWVLHSRSLQ